MPRMLVVTPPLAGSPGTAMACKPMRRVVARPPGTVPWAPKSSRHARPIPGRARASSGALEQKACLAEVLHYVKT